jgi:hypothetical protein
MKFAARPVTDEQLACLANRGAYAFDRRASDQPVAAASQRHSPVTMPLQRQSLLTCCMYKLLPISAGNCLPAAAAATAAAAIADSAFMIELHKMHAPLHSLTHSLTQPVVSLCLVSVTDPAFEQHPNASVRRTVAGLREMKGKAMAALADANAFG